jgi:glucose-1-phosphate thymidylyltransferase
MVNAGITDIMVVTGGNHAGEFLRLLGDGRELGVKRLSYAYQAQAGGIAEALGLTESFVDGDKLLVMLGDNILEYSVEQAVENFQRQERGGRVLLKEMEDPSHLRHLGVPIIENGRILFVREKPQNPPSQYAVIGLYMYNSDVFDIVKTLKPSGRGELEITDVNNAFIERGEMEYDVIEGFWGDAGESIEVYYEIIDFVRANGVNKKAKASTPAASPAGVS